MSLRCPKWMGLFLATAGAVIGMTLMVLAVHQRTKTSPDERIRFFSTLRGDQRRQVWRYVLPGALVLGVSGGYLVSHLPLWVLALGVTPAIPIQHVLIYRHNNQIRTRTDAVA